LVRAGPPLPWTVPDGAAVPPAPGITALPWRSAGTAVERGAALLPVAALFGVAGATGAAVVGRLVGAAVPVAGAVAALFGAVAAGRLAGGAAGAVVVPPCANAGAAAPSNKAVANRPRIVVLVVMVFLLGG
jgi:hypothetical protein